MLVVATLAVKLDICIAWQCHLSDASNFIRFNTRVPTNGSQMLCLLQ